MKRLIAGVIIVVVCGAVAMSTVIPKDPRRINVPFVRQPCPKEFTVTECNWWESYQDKEEARWNELIRQVNRGNSLAFEAVRGVAP